MNGNDLAMVIALQNKSAEKLTTSDGVNDAGKLLGVKDDGSVGAVNLTVGTGEVAVDSTLSISGAAADAKAVGDVITLTDAEVTSLTGLLN